MAKYYKKIDDRSKISTRSGNDITLPEEFTNLSSSIIRLCSYVQVQMQQIIYISHGSELREAKQTLKNSPNPKARMEFLTSFEYGEEDPVIATVFNYSKELFLEIYELRNVLAHENWMSSADFENVVLFSKLSEEAKLGMAKGKLWHENKTTSQDIYNASIRYIRNVKIISVSNLEKALKDVNLCAWVLMQICIVLNQSDPIKKAEMRKAFFTFKGTSHLFDGGTVSTGIVDVTSSQGKSIRG